jgi:hypothetical protein
MITRATFGLTEATIVGALSLEQNDEWQLQDRYMSLEALRPSMTTNQFGCPP